jgi:undecaprenyl-diphosphatase
MTTLHLTIWQTIALSLLQGLTELFPISSLGHTVILPGLLPSLFGSSNLQTDTSCGGQSCFLPIITALHIGTSIALVIYFWRDWWQVILTLVKSIKEGEVRTGTDEWVSFLIIIGVIPAGLIGVALETPLKQLFTSPVIAAAFLVVNGSVLFMGDRMRRRAVEKAQYASTVEGKSSFRPLSSLTWKEAIIVGLCQSLALVPGFSRSGVTMVGGLGVRLNYEDAARFSFLLGTPLIFLAGALEIPQLVGQTGQTLELVFIGMVISGVTAYLSTKFLMKYFEKGTLLPFACYCWGAGLVALILFATVLHGAVH